MKNDRKTLRLDVDFDLWLTETEIEASVYVGATDEPQLVVTESLESLIDKTLEAYGWSDKIHSAHKEDVERLLTTLKNAYEYAERRVQELGFSDPASEE